MFHEYSQNYYIKYNLINYFIMIYFILIHINIYFQIYGVLEINIDMY